MFFPPYYTHAYYTNPLLLNNLPPIYTIPIAPRFHPFPTLHFTTLPITLLHFTSLHFLTFLDDFHYTSFHYTWFECV